jgi:citrate synthase
MGWSSTDRIVVQGRDLTGEILGKLNLGDMAFLELTGRLPTPQQSAVFNAMLVTLVEHGLTPQTIAARLVYMCSPESLQAAVAAGLCGVGSVFAGGSEGTAKLLQEVLAKDPQADLAAEPGVSADYQQADGHSRIAMQRAAAGGPRALSFPSRLKPAAGRYVELLELIAAEAGAYHQRPLPINATGAMGRYAANSDSTGNYARDRGQDGRSDWLAIWPRKSVNPSRGNQPAFAEDSVEREARHQSRFAPEVLTASPLSVQEPGKSSGTFTSNWRPRPHHHEIDNCIRRPFSRRDC